MLFPNLKSKKCHQNKRNVYYVKSTFPVYSAMYLNYFCQVSIGLNKTWRSSNYFDIDCF